MKYRFFKVGLFAALGVLFLQACQKTSTPSTPYTQLEGNWKLTQTATDDNDNGILDRNELVNVSNDVEFLKFNKDLTGTQTITINDTTNTYAFTWNLANNDSELIRIEDGDSIVSQIDNINSTDLTLRQNTTPVISWELYSKQ